MIWIHDISQSALAAAVLALGLVILLELHSVARLRRAVDRDMARVFEQLDLLRFEIQQRIEARAPPHDVPIALPVQAAVWRAPAGTEARPDIGNDALAAAHRLAATGASPGDLVDRCGLATGEAPLLLALQAAPARRAV